MRFIYMIAAIAIVTPAFAEDQPAAVPVPQHYYVELDAADINNMSQALNELPKRIADPLINKISVQLQAQARSEQAQKDAAEKYKSTHPAQ